MTWIRHLTTRAVVLPAWLPAKAAWVLVLAGGTSPARAVRLEGLERVLLVQDLELRQLPLDLLPVPSVPQVVLQRQDDRRVDGAVERLRLGLQEGGQIDRKTESYLLRLFDTSKIST
jgi:hypothetical protein